MTKSYDELLTDLSSYNERTKTATETYESSLGDIVTATIGVVKDRNNANKWASEAEDVLVDDGVNTPDYSANHYSKKAATDANRAESAADSVPTLEVTQEEIRTRTGIYKVGNISDHVGQTLLEADKINSYQYPDNSDDWFGVKDGETFPITIPADPSAPGSGWALVNALTADSLTLYTDIVYKASGGSSAVANMVSGVPIAAKVGDKCSTGGTTWDRVSELGGDISDFIPLGSVEASDFSGDISNQTDGCNECASLCIANEYTMSMIGKYNSDKITFDGDINLVTSCIVNSINDVDIFEFKNGKVMHSGTCEVIGVNREGLSTGVTFEASLASTMGTFEITNVALGVDYKSIGNSNLITWEKIRCYNVSWWYDTTFTKGTDISPPNIYNIGEITTPSPINTRTGAIVIDGKSYPICEKSGATNTYYVGAFNDLPASGSLRHFTGGGVLHQRHTDNGAIVYDKIMLLSCRGISICTQAFYGVTVSGGEIEGCQTSAIVGGIYENAPGDPRTILSVRSNFTGIHTEGNVAQEPLVYSLSQSGINFGGNLIRDGIRGTFSGIAFQNLEGDIVTTNEIAHLTRDTAGSNITPISANSTIYRNVNINGTITNITLRDLKSGIDIIGDRVYGHHSKLTFGLYDLPEGQTHTVTFTPDGSNTVNGGISPVSVDVVGVAGKTLIEVYAVLVGDDFTIMLP